MSDNTNNNTNDNTTDNNSGKANDYSDVLVASIVTASVILFVLNFVQTGGLSEVFKRIFG